MPPAPGVLDELRKRNPRTDRVERSRKHTNTSRVIMVSGVKGHLSNVTFLRKVANGRRI